MNTEEHGVHVAVHIVYLTRLIGKSRTYIFIYIYCIRIRIYNTSIYPYLHSYMRMYTVHACTHAYQGTCVRTYMCTHNAERVTTEKSD